MNWKTTLLAVTFVFIAVFGGLFFLLQSSDEIKPGLRPVAPDEKKSMPEDTEVEEEGNEISNTKNFPSQQEADEEILRRSLKDRTIGECEAIEDEQIYNECHDGILLALALEKSVVNKCDEIFNEKQKEYCRDQVFYFLARDQKEYNGCPEIKNKSTQEKCLQLAEKGLVYSARNFDDCAAVSDAGLRKTCEGRFSVLMAKKDPEAEVCNFSDEKTKRECEIEDAAQVARREGNLSSCDAITNDEDRKKCLLRLQEIMNTEERNSAIQRGDTEDCLIILDREEQIFCLDRAHFVRAGNEYDVSICEKIINETLRKSCLEKVSEKAAIYFSQKAKKEKSPEWCDYITESVTQISCRNFFK